jgi:hypothetical protein
MSYSYFWEYENVDVTVCDRCPHFRRGQNGRNYSCVSAGRFSDEMKETRTKMNCDEQKIQASVGSKKGGGIAAALGNSLKKAALRDLNTFKRNLFK